ncbi:MAG: cyclic nucleotide-binding domain-containing protein [Thermoleophilaceae bacterium]
MDASRLKKIDVFSSLSDEELQQLAGIAEESRIEEGETIVRAGTWPYQLFAIEEGSAEVRRDGESVAELGAGDVVGETGVVNRGLRNADVVATGPVQVVYFTHSQVKQMRREMPELGERLESIAAERGG